MLRFLTFFFLAFPFLLPAQQIINASMQHDGMARKYIVYKSSGYSDAAPNALVLNFHGYTSNGSQQMFYTNFNAVADTANFLLVYPEGTVFQGNTHWNVGGFTNGSTVDDVGFVDALLDTLMADYNVDANRIYSTGMSNGGFFSYRLACELGHRIAAIASVTGSMTPSAFNNCTPAHPTPVLQIHGTADATVPYNGASFSKPVEEVVAYWANANGCDANATVVAVPDINTADGTTVEHFTYPNCNQDAAVELYKIANGQHTWPSAAFAFPGTNYDINASVEVWRFFLRYDLASLNGTNALEEQSKNVDISIAPNPAQNSLKIQLKSAEDSNGLTIFSMTGKIVRQMDFYGDSIELDISGLEKGVYFLKIGNFTGRFVKG